MLGWAVFALSVTELFGLTFWVRLEPLTLSLLSSSLIPSLVRPLACLVGGEGKPFVILPNKCLVDFLSLPLSLNSLPYDSAS